MAILRSTDGKFYEVADEELEEKLIPAEELKKKLGGVAKAEKADPDKVEGEVNAHGWCWRRNCFSNCWRRNCFRNCYR